MYACLWTSHLLSGHFQHAGQVTGPGSLLQARQKLLLSIVRNTPINRTLSRVGFSPAFPRCTPEYKKQKKKKHTHECDTIYNNRVLVKFLLFLGVFSGNACNNVDVFMGFYVS